MAPLRWTTTDRFSVEHGVKIGCYGASGYGKTKLISTAPRPLILSAEKGLLSLRGFQIPTIEIQSLAELKEAYNWIRGSAESKNFDMICIDSVSELAETVLSNALELAKDPRQAYGQVLEIVTEEIKKFRDLSGKHVYMIFKMEPAKDEMTGIIKYGPMFPGKKLGPQTPYLLDEFFVLRLHLNKDANGMHYRYLQTQPDLQYDAKDRSGSLAVVEPPDLNHIIRKIMGA